MVFININYVTKIHFTSIYIMLLPFTFYQYKSFYKRSLFININQIKINQHDGKIELISS